MIFIHRKPVETGATVASTIENTKMGISGLGHDTGLIGNNIAEFRASAIPLDPTVANVYSNHSQNGLFRIDAATIKLTNERMVDVEPNIASMQLIVFIQKTDLFHARTSHLTELASIDVAIGIVSINHSLSLHSRKVKRSKFTAHHRNRTMPCGRKSCVFRMWPLGKSIHLNMTTKNNVSGFLACVIQLWRIGTNRTMRCQELVITATVDNQWGFFFITMKTIIMLECLNIIFKLGHLHE